MEMSPRVRRAGIVLVIAGAVAGGYAACGGDGGGTPTTPDEPSVATVEVSPGSATIAVGETQQFNATARDADGNVLSGTDFSWRSSNSTVATVDDQGLASGQAEGQAQIIATADGVDGSADLTVTSGGSDAAAVAKISGDGQNGMTLQPFPNPLVVEVTDGSGNAVSGAAVDWSVTQGAASLSDQSTTTGADGRTSVDVTSDTLLVEHSIRAEISTGQGAESVSFQLETTVAYFEIGDNFFEDWQGRRNTDFEADGDIVVGDTLMWEYVDGATQHTVTSGEGQDGGAGDGVPTGGSSFDSGFLEPGDTFRWVPDAAGTWTYFCEVHPTTMYDAVILVDEAGGSSVRTASARNYEPGDVVRPEGSHFAFVYLGPPDVEK